MTDGITLHGGWQLINQTASVEIAGLDCGDFLVDSTGSIFVPFGADPDGLLTPAYLNVVSNPFNLDPGLVGISITNGASDTIVVYVTVLIGYTYTSAGQTMRPNAENQLKLQQGSGLGKKKRFYQIGALFTNAQGIQFAGTNGIFQPADFRNSRDVPLTKDQLFTGVYWGAATDSDSYDGQISWQITRPYPCTINALSAYMETSDG